MKISKQFATFAKLDVIRTNGVACKLQLAKMIMCCKQAS